VKNVVKPRLVVEVDESAVGVGKTYNAIRVAVVHPCRYLFVVERRESIREIERRIADMSRGKVAVVTIMSEEAALGYSVRQEVEALPERYPDGHLIAICTHRAMMMSDLSAFSGWRIVIDETPDVLTQQEVQSKCDLAFFQAHYTLTPISSEWSTVTLTEAGRRLDGGDLNHDDSHQHLRLFHQRVTAASDDVSPDNRRAVICNLPDWAAMTSDNVKWTWWSLFSLSELAAFETITILANGFMESVAAKMLEAWTQDVAWAPRSSNGTRDLVHRNVTIRYFSERPSSLRFFESEIGKQHLRAIGDHIAENVDARRFIWSANARAKVALDLPSASYFTPRQSGTDRLMHYTQAAMIYAAKPSQNVRNVLRALGIESTCWTNTTEHETILQFLTRTSIRDVASSAHVAVFVYSRDQADYLKRFLDRQPHIQGEIEFVDLGLKYPESKPGRPKDAPVSLEEARHKAEALKQRRAAQQRLRRALRRAA